MINIAPGPRLATLFALLVGCLCCPVALAQSKSAPASDAAPARQEMLAGITVRASDAFYDAPAQLPNRPGALLRSEPLKDVALPAGIQGWRILYTTTVDDSTPATAVATVFAPIQLPAGPLPAIIWEHGTTGLLQKCMPSLVSAPTVGIPAVDRVAKAGWAIVATDYSFAEKSGPHPYLIGEGEARAGLDSLRAARQMPELTLDERTVVWGHSQGGHSALWTGIVGPNYAPDVKIVGVAAIAPAANMANILAMNVAVDKRLGPYLALSYSRFYPDITFERAIRPEALNAAREITNLCGFFPPSDPQRISALTATFEGRALTTSTNPALAARLAQNTADHAIAAPLVVVPPAATNAYIDERCGAGQQLEYWTFAGLDHGGIVQPGTSLDEPLVAWTTARFAKQPAPSGCPRKSF
jgi:acetyl esterase/lipase